MTEELEERCPYEWVCPQIHRGYRCPHSEDPAQCEAYQIIIRSEFKKEKK